MTPTRGSGVATVGLRASGVMNEQTATVPVSAEDTVSLANHSSGSLDVVANVVGYYTSDWVRRGRGRGTELLAQNRLFVVVAGHQGTDACSRSRDPPPPGESLLMLAQAERGPGLSVPAGTVLEGWPA
jgi:hypothetical protein